MTLAISTTSIPGSLADKVAAIAKAGFTGLELHEPDFTGFHGSAHDLRTMVEDCGLKTNLLKPFNDLEGWEGEAGGAGGDTVTPNDSVAPVTGLHFPTVRDERWARCASHKGCATSRSGS